VSEADSAFREGRAWRRPGPWLLGALLLLYFTLAVGSARQKSVTVDELGHLPSGLYFLLTGDARYSALNPPLVNVLSAIPVLFLDLERAPEPPPPSDDVLSFWSTGYHFQEMHRADYVRIFGVARWVPILIAACLGVLAFLCARQLAPEAPDVAGLLAAGFVCLSPNVIAQARLVGTDTGTAFFVLLALWSLRGMLRNPRVGPSLLCGAALGLAQLAKFYALLLYPTFLLVALAWRALAPPPRPRVRRLLACLACAFAVSLLVLDSGYLWREVGASLSDLSLRSAPLARWQGSIVGSLPLPVPGTYVRALDGQLFEVDSTIPTFLLGQSFQGGRWYFYLATLALKTPIGLFVAFGLALFLSIPRPRLPWHEVVLLLAYPLALFLSLSLSGGRQLGGRALLSAVPLVWIFTAAAVARTWPLRWPSALAALALIGTVAASVWSYPNYLSYFNAFVGGSQEGYRYASDANVDIGQDLVLLARYLEEQRAERVQLLYFGSVDPALYGIDFEIPEGRLKPGLFAVSVSLYHMGYPMYGGGELHVVGPVAPVGIGDPIAKIGGSIHVYRVGP
jgi:4-amino-4-deoxy-L-arabinose transferase-like glycosyltransferase